jgi:putative peptide zinc metalloprotease protein
VIGDTPGQGARLLKRRDDQKRKKVLGAMANVFALRWRGIDPDKLLDWLYKFTWWMFTPTAVVICLLFGLSALSLVVVQFEVFSARLPAFHEFFGPRNWLYLGITMGLVKVLHEFGHGLSCKHFGGECHEMGFMLLVFTPALYCNVSDSWMLPSKYRRAAIGAAGMYVEMIIASFATYIWWFSDPASTLNQICLSVMFICSVSTLIFNGNPLLRFDGYYILSDLAEIPNLRQKATTALRRLLIDWCLGLEQPEDPFLPKKNQLFLAIYTVAAVAYRWIVVFSIMMFLNEVLEPYGLKVLGQIIALSGLFGLIVQPTVQLVKFLYVPGRMHQVKKGRLLTSVAIVAAVVGLICFLPLPFYVSATLEVKPREAESVFVRVPGKLEEIRAAYGSKVSKGDEIARLSNQDLELDLIKLEGDRDRQQKELDISRRVQNRDPEAGQRIPELEKSLAMIDEQLAEKRAQQAKLTIAAPTGGVVMRIPDRPEPKDESRLHAWLGSPLSERNIGAHLQASELLCLVGNPRDLEAMLVVDQADIDFVQEKQTVKIRFDAFPDETFVAKIDEVARSHMTVAPPGMTAQAGGTLATRTDAEGRPTPLSTSYQAWAPLPKEAGELELPLGLRGQGRIYAGNRSIGSRIWRYVLHTFHFQM